MTQVSSCSDALVSLSGAGLRRAGRWLVRNIDLCVRPGEIVTLVGPNGSGKSTTAKLALGLLRPDEGRVTRLSTLRVGYVPQKLVIDWSLPLTVRRLVTLAKKYSDAAVAAALEKTGIAGMENAPVQSLSGGEFQRVLLARAIVGEPQLLVLDEPAQGVDFTGEASLYELIGAVRDATGCGVLLISHDLHIVMAKTDKVICLNGHVCCTGTPERVSADPAYTRLFGKHAAHTLALYRHDHDHTHLPDGSILSGNAAGGDSCEHDHSDRPTSGGGDNV